MPFALLGLALACFLFPFVANRDDIASLAGMAHFSAWVVGCWPVAVVLVIWAIFEWAR